MEDIGVCRDCPSEASNDTLIMKRKFSERELPCELPLGEEPSEYTPEHKKERRYYNADDPDSPSSFPKHVIVPTSDKLIDDPFTASASHMTEEQRNTQAAYSPPEKSGVVQVLTPESINRARPSASYDSQPISYHQPYHDVYRTPSYNPDMDYGRGSYGAPPAPASHNNGSNNSGGGESFVRNRRWACDVCNVATFLSYEEACAHEEVCSRRYHETQQPYHDPRQPPRPPPPAYNGHHGPAPAQGSGLGALYHASQEVVTPPTPHRHSASRWGTHGPPLPVFPHEQNYYRGHYDSREEPVPYYDNNAYHHHQHPHHSQQYRHHHNHHHHQPQHPQYPPVHHQGHHPSSDYYHKRMLLALPGDRDSLSDRQCYVRSEMVEIFAATDKDVSARHSKGAQKLVMGQIGIRCVHCSHLRPRDRAERAVCYPSSISRIYQTVADMQRFHFEQCREIPDHVRQLYKKLKTTRPRGVGSPQTYWMSSSKLLNLVDTEGGIRFDSDGSATKEPVSDMSIGTH